MTSRPHVAAPGGGTAEEYLSLEPRPKSWRRQLFLKGRNLSVGQLVFKMRADGHTPPAAADDYGLSLAQIQEALRYYERHRELIEQEADEARRQLEAHGITVDAPAVR